MPLWHSATSVGPRRAPIPAFGGRATIMRREASRLPAVDALKALACVLIVLHHLAFYGPMADVVRPLMPATIDFLDEYARMAVQIFLVVSGFLFASKFGPFGSAPR